MCKELDSSEEILLITPCHLQLPESISSIFT